jgi:hypothetical protein
MLASIVWYDLGIKNFVALVLQLLEQWHPTFSEKAA